MSTRIRHALTGVLISELFLTVPAAHALSATDAGYIDVTVSPYGADNTGITDVTAVLQTAIRDATQEKKPLYLPAGRYRISGTLRVDNCPYGREESGIMIKGPSHDESQRAVLYLESGSFTEPGSPQAMIHLVTGDGCPRPADRFDAVVQSVDFEIDDNNAGAYALDWWGAEGCGLFDITIGGTNGYTGFKYGIKSPPASGGMSADITITGGDIGIYASPTREVTTFADVRVDSCATAAVYSDGDWHFNVVGGSFGMKKGVPCVIGGGHGGGDFRLTHSNTFVDCRIEWAQPDEHNLLITWSSSPCSFAMWNVYTRNCAFVCVKQDAVQGRSSGWRRYREFAYDADNYGSVDCASAPVKTPIYIDGVRQSATVHSVHGDDEAPPPDLQTRHGWGPTLPDFNTPGAVVVTDYAAHKDGSDWAPAFNKAIADGRDVIIVPTGVYELHGPIDMHDNTAIVGTHSWFSTLVGVDSPQGKRFGGSTNAPVDAQPMIRTPDNPGADCMLIDVLVLYNTSPYNLTPLAVYPCLWRAGGSSVIKNARFFVSAYKMPGNARDWHIYRGFAPLSQDAPGVSLRFHQSPVRTNGYQFTGDNNSHYHEHTPIDDQLITEVISGNKRLVAPSQWDYPDEATPPPFTRKANIGIDRNGEDFAIGSLELYNPSPDPRRGGDVKIVRIDASGRHTDSTLVSLKDKSRTDVVGVALGWSGCKTVELTCRTQFSIDNVVLDGGAAIGFEDLTGEAPVQDRHFDCWEPAGKVRDMGLCPQFNSHIIIEGGVKWYSVRNHGGGDGLLNPRCGRTRIRNNDAPVHIYNFHDQHSAQDGSIILENARYVSIYGLKTEQTNSLLRCYNSGDIRVFGMGNTTNHVVGHAYVHFDECTNYVAAVMFDRLLCDKGVTWCSPDCFGRICFVARQLCAVTHPVEEVVGGSFATTASMERPVLLKSGSPGDPFEWGGAGIAGGGRFGDENPAGSKARHSGLEIRTRGTDGALHIALTKPGDSDALLRVTDLSGREVWQRRIRGAANACVVSPTLGAGAYVVSLEAGTGRRVAKVIAR